MGRTQCSRLPVCLLKVIPTARVIEKMESLSAIRPGTSQRTLNTSDSYQLPIHNGKQIQNRKKYLHSVQDQLQQAWLRRPDGVICEQFTFTWMLSWQQFHKVIVEIHQNTFQFPPLLCLADTLALIIKLKRNAINNQLQQCKDYALYKILLKCGLSINSTQVHK